MIYNKILSYNIAKLCSNHNIKTEKLECDLIFEPGTIKKWESEIAIPSLIHVIKVSEYFNTSIDSLIGRDDLNDGFLNKLIKKTMDETIIWKPYLENAQNPKEYKGLWEFNGAFRDDDEFENFKHHYKESSYYISANDGYISIYGQYYDSVITEPEELKLFIQPTNDSDLVEQNYSTEELMLLWLKVLYSLKEQSPDEIKAEEFKNEFVKKF